MRTSLCVAAICCALLLSGCSTAPVITTTQTNSGQGATLKGKVYGGQQPIASATINLYEVGTTGYGSAPTLLYTTQTDSNGNFSFPIASWNSNCTNVSSGSNSPIPVYITSSGGNAGGGTNSAIVLMAALGPCNGINASTFAFINEVTTVAAAYALGPFMNPSNPTQIGSVGSSQTGILNAFATAGNLANSTTGVANTLTPNGNGSVPQAEINTLADILAYCVNGNSGTCATLESDAFNTSGSTLGTSFTTPTNTLMAAQQIAAYPGNNVGTLYGLVSGTPPFVGLGGAPNDWTVAVQYAANGSDTTVNPRVSLAVDASGNVWIANLNESNVETIDNQGVPLFSPQTSNISTPTGLAVDLVGNVWVANEGNNTVFALCSNGGGVCSQTYNNTTACNNSSPCGIDSPYSLAFDGNANLWVVNNGTPSLTELFDVGNGPSTNNNFAIYTPSSVTNPEFLAIDLSGNAWVADYGSGKSGADAVEELSAHGVTLAKETGSGLSDPEDVAVDRSGNIWVGNKSGSVLTEYSSGGSVLSGGSGFSGGGINDPTVVVVDGANRIWTANGGNNSISEFSNGGTAISPSTGYKSSGLNGTSGQAIDQSGNVWVSSSTPTAIAGTSDYGAITEFVGAAAPVVTPLAQGLANGQLGVTPGTPTPVSILTTTLPYYAKSAGGYSHPYNAQLLASGGSGSYSWSTTSGATLTGAGLSLSSGGLISGTPTESGPLAINVTVTDSTNLSNSASTTLTLYSADEMASSPGANDSQLTGTYTFFASGIKNDASQAGSAPMVVYAGSMTADGAGNLTGEFDSNNSKGFDSGSSGPISFTGYYTVSSSNIGFLAIVPQVNEQAAFSFAFSAEGSTTYQKLQFIRYDDTDVPVSGTGANDIGAGFAELQTSATLATGSWVFGFQGETPCTTLGGTINTGTCSAGTPSPYGPLGAAGVFTLNGSGTVTTGEEDASAVCPQTASSCSAYNYNAVSLSGSYGSPDGSGRGTITLTPGGTLYPDAPTHFVYYVVSSTEIVMISSNSHATYSMLGGDVVLQQGAIGNGTLANDTTLIPYMLGARNGDGASIYPTQSTAQIVIVGVTNPGGSCSGAPSFNITIYKNDGGNYQAAQSQGTLCVSVASNGRLTFTGAGANAPVGYVTGSGTAGSSFAFLSQQVKSAGDSPGLLRTELQTATAFTSSSCDMSYGTLPPPVPMTVNVGYLSSTSCPTSAYSSTWDESGSGGLLESGAGTTDVGTDSSGVISPDTDSAGNNETILVITPTRGLVLDANPGDTTPYLSILQQ